MTLPEGTDAPQELITQADFALTAGAYLAALVPALTVPDMCAAIDDPSGRTTRTRYVSWMAMHALYSQEHAELVYGFRCSILHQGTGREPHKAPRFDRVLFTPPGPLAMHRHEATMGNPPTTVAIFDISLFIRDVAAAVSRWLAARGEVEHVQHNLARTIRVYKDGLPPYFVGMPVVG